ncbi:MAG: DoxX family membrane protein [bacterium]
MAERKRSWGMAPSFLRLALAVVLLFQGIETFTRYNVAVNGMVTNFSETWLPAVLVRACGYALPFIQVGLGGLLLIGLFIPVAAFFMSIYLLVCIFGSVLLADKATTSVEAYLVLLIVTQFVMLLGPTDHFSLDDRRGATVA